MLRAFRKILKITFLAIMFLFTALSVNLLYDIISPRSVVVMQNYYVVPKLPDVSNMTPDRLKKLDI